jgi:RNA polymerase sigma-70 factor (ECF subfamily)
MDQAEERQLVKRLTRMNEEAWREFCRLYAEPVAAFVRAAFGCGREDSEEIAQMAFVRCVRSIGSFDPRRGRLQGWLKAVARNEARTFLSARGERRREIPQSLLPPLVAEQLLLGLDGNPLPDDLAAREDVCGLVRGALADVNSRGGEALRLKYMQGLPVSEIAKRLNASEKAVESLLTRARETFRTELVRRLGPGWREEIR